MISKRIPMKSAKKSSFTGLVKYITDSQGITERVGEVRITNCLNDDLAWAMKEVRETQNINTTATGDKTYHLLISFAPGEKPTPEVLQDVEERLCAAMGYSEHQRISAVHSDTDVVHVHVAINKIHPTRHTMHEPYRDFKVRADMCAKLEVEHGLQRVNHAGAKHLSESKANDMERHAGIESLVSWIRRECLPQIHEANTWNALHQRLHENGLSLQERGTGFVIASGDGTSVKASTVARELSRSKLEERLGSFKARQSSSGKPGQAKLDSATIQRPGIGRVGRRPPARSKGRPHQSLSSVPSLQIDSGKHYSKRPLKSRIDTTELYALYRDDQAAVRAERMQQVRLLRLARDKAVEEAKRRSAVRRAAIKLMGGSAATKKLLYAQAFKSLQADLANVRAEHDKTKAQINSSYKPRQWADWLQTKAKQGNEEALQALRAREWSSGIRGDALAPAAPVLTRTAFKDPAVTQDHITKEGTIIYQAGASAIRDDGARLQLSRGTTAEGVETALRMATARYGKTINVTGSAEFKELVAQSAATRNLSIQFADTALEQRRLFLLQQIAENNHDRSNRGRAGSGNGRSDGRDVPGAGAQSRQRDLGNTTGTTRSPGAADGAGDAPRAGIHGVAGERGVGARSVPVRSPTGAGKPCIGRVGRKPPAQAKNRMRALSELGLVQLANRGEVLLPRHVPDNVDHQGAERADRLRRDVPDGRVTGPEPDAAHKYIAEREGKRTKGFDIPKHRLYTSADSGAATYAGLRTIEGQHLVLFNRNQEVLVMPVDEATARRAKRMKLGEAITTTSTGGIKRKGRSR